MTGRAPDSTARAILGASVGWLGISMISDGVPTLLLPYRLAVAGTEDAATLGIAALIGILLAALLQPFAGAWSDSVGRWPVVLVGVVLTGAGLALFVFSSEVTALVYGLVLALCGVSVVQAGQQALLPDAVDVSRRGVASGLKGAFDVGGALLGFIVLAALLGVGQFAESAAAMWIVLAAGALIGFALIGRSRRVLASAGAQEAFALARNPFAGDWSAHAPLLRLIAVRFVFLLGIYVVGRFLFTFVAAHFGLSPDEAAGQAGVVLTVLAAATVAASLPTGWLADRLGRARLMQAGGLLGAVGIALVPFVPTVGALMLVGLLIAAGSAAFGSGSWALLSDLAAGPESGRLMGLAQLGTAGAAAAAGLFGLLIDAGERFSSGAGYAAAFALAAAAALLGALLWRVEVPVPQPERPVQIEVVR